MKSHTFRTLAEIVDAIDEKNIGVFLSDFSEWLAIEIAMKGNDTIKSGDHGSMQWNDDGVKGISKLTIEIKSKP
jgi:hypothetical protein